MRLEDVEFIDEKEEQERDYPKKSKGTKVFFFTGLVLFLISATILAGVFLYMGNDSLFRKSEPEEVIPPEELPVYTEADMQAKIEAVSVEAKEKGYSEGVSEMKETLRNASLEDSGVLMLLRDYFGENMIFTYGSKFEYFPINHELAPNTINNDFLVLDEESGIITYEPDGQKTSHLCVDVSSFQQKINWKTVKAAGVEYAMIRCALRGYGTGKVVEDKYFYENIEGALDAGIKVGVYFYSQAISAEEAREEVRFLLEMIEPYDIKLPVAIDVEEVNDTARTDNLTSDERTDISVAFMEAVKEAGYTPMIYSNLKYFFKHLNVDKLEGYEKWYAFYNDEIYYPYEISMWQYTANGKINGIPTAVDLNVCFKDY